MGTVLNPALSSVHVMNHLKLRLATVSEKIRSKLKKRYYEARCLQRKGVEPPDADPPPPPPLQICVKRNKK